VTEYTERRIIVTRVEDAAEANTAAKQVDTVGGELTFAEAEAAVGVRWCNWAMKPEEAEALEAEFAARRILHDIELRPDAAGDFHPEVQAHALIFDTTEWAPEEVQAVLAAVDPEFAQGLPEGAIDGVVL
jgi:hypothetical protein